MLQTLEMLIVTCAVIYVVCEVLRILRKLERLADAAERRRTQPERDAATISKMNEDFAREHKKAAAGEPRV